MIRIGEGYDVHKLVPGKDLILGGTKISFEKGLLGHSDADVLLHAIMDALLGSMSLYDIGKHFPDTDDRYKGISSLKLLSVVKNEILPKSVVIHNIDATIICQAPKLRPYIDQMRKNISEVLNLSLDRVNVKATTEEGLGYTGEGLGIAASAVCIVDDGV